MATILDVSLTGYFSVMFTFLFVFVIVYAILEYMKPFGKDANKGWHAMLALSVAVLTVTYKPAVGIINFLAPWFLILAILIFFILFALGVFGLKESDFANAARKDSTIYTFIIVFAIVFLVIALGSVFGQSFLSKEDAPTNELPPVDSSDPPATSADGTPIASGDDYQENVYNAIFHPKVLGFVFLMLVAVFTIVFLTKSQGRG